MPGPNTDVQLLNEAADLLPTFPADKAQTVMAAGRISGHRTPENFATTLRFFARRPDVDPEYTQTLLAFARLVLDCRDKDRVVKVGQSICLRSGQWVHGPALLAGEV